MRAVLMRTGVLGRLACAALGLGGDRADLVDHVHAFDDLAEHRIAVRRPGSDSRAADCRRR